MIVNKKKRICWIADIAVRADHSVKLKGDEKREKYLYLTRELEKLWNMKVMVVIIAIGALVTVTKGLVQALKDLEIRTRVETSKQHPWLQRPEYKEEALRLKENSPTQTPVKDHQLILMWKIYKGAK